MKIEFYHVDAFEVPNYEPIWRWLKKMGVDARLVGAPGDHNTASANWFDFDRFKNYCTEHSLPFTTDADPTANLAITTQNADILRDYHCPRVRLMYGPVMYPLAWGLQDHSAKPFDAILTHSKMYTDFFSAWLRAEQLPVVGYPRYDDFFAGKLQRNVIHARWGVTDNRPVLVFLPTWGDNTAFDIFFPSLLRLTSQYNIILRPHHCTLRMEPKRLALLKSSGLLILENAFDLTEVYAGADIIVADTRSSGLLEACLCNVPTVGMVINPAEISSWLAKCGIDRMLSVCSDPNQLEAAINTALTSKAQADNRQRWAEQCVAYRDGTAGQQAADALIKLATSQTKPTKQTLPTNSTGTKKIVFLLGSANLSGGTYVILQHAQHLQKLGHQVTIALVFMTMPEFTTLKNSSKCWHPAIKELQFVHINDCLQYKFDLAIFTWWATLFSFEKINAATFVYFVQSIESRFYRKDETFMRNLVNRTYQLGLPIITEASWIKEYLQHYYKSNCQLVRNGMLKSVYNENGKKIAEKSQQQLRILVEGPLDAPYKNVARTIELCKKADVGEIWLLTSSPVESYPGVAKVFSRIPIEQTPEVYRSCDVLVKLSYVEGMFGPPLEMFHCGGTAIVYEVTGFDEYIQHDVNALVAKKNDEQAVIQYLKCLHEDRNLLAKLISGAKETASQWINWEQSSVEFACALEAISPQEPPLTHIKKYFMTEHIDVISIKDNAPIKTTLDALPLYNSGQYSLTISIDEGETQLGIAFGKLYQRFHVLSLGAYSNDKSAVDGHIGLRLNQINQNPDKSFDCSTESGTIFVNISMKSVNANSDTKLYFYINFSPLVIRENLLTQTTEDHSLLIQ